MMSGERRRIIIVDDDRDTCRLLQKQLETAGYQVDAFARARETFELINTLGTAIVVADWDMPEMNGLELCRAIRELEALHAVQNIYFILLTAHRSKEHVVEGLEAGANDYLTKPYHSGELLARVQVGERMLRLQSELLQRNIEIQRAHADLAVLAHKLELQASTDALTGLLNRRCIIARFQEAWDASVRYQAALSCIMLDLDHFKAVNDNYGHDAGDAVIVHVAKLLKQMARRPDLVGRFGGEEFVLLCPALDAHEACTAAEEIRATLAHTPVRTAAGPIAVGVSLGVAERTDAMTGYEALLRLTDQVMYAAKRNGRNQTWYCDPRGLHMPLADHPCPACPLPAVGAFRA